MSIHTRLLKYIIPHTGSILLALFCALVISLCELCYVRILEDTIDALKIMEEGLPAKVSYFHIKGYLPGINPTLKDLGDAFRLVMFIAAGLFLFVIVKGIFTYGNAYLMFRVGYKLVVRLRQEMYNKITLSPLSLLKQQRAGDLIMRVINDAAALRDCIGSTADVLRSAVIVVVFPTIMFIKSWKLALLTLLVLPSLSYLINQFGKRIRKTSTRVQEKGADITAHLEEKIPGMPIIKSFTTEEREMQQFAAENQRQYRFALKRVRLKALQTPLIELFSAVGIVSVFGFGCWQVINGKFTTGDFVGYIVMAGMVFKPIRRLGTFNSTLQQTLASVERIFYVLDFPAETSEFKGRIELPEIRGEVEFQNVSFSYDDDTLVLRNINFKALPGATIALGGRSGVGKTTLLNLLPRFYEATEGEILIDGYKVKEVKLKSLRSQIAIVPQDVILFNGTIAENILYGNPNATFEAVAQAAKQANAHNFIRQLPQGYETQIRERGTLLSGGQQQRLTIARAILKAPKILLLDEATSDLDSESEMLIQESLANLMQGRTTFVIAHRLATVRNADKILILDRGQIVESGTHQQLMAQNGLYRDLCAAQMK